MSDETVNYDEDYAGIICVRSGVDGCPPCGKVDITRGQYLRQIHDPDSTWFCPHCGGNAVFDDDRFEEIQEAQSK